MGDPAGAGELERQQRQDRGRRGDHRRAGVAGSAHHGGQVEGDQVGNREFQPGEGSLAAVGSSGEVDHSDAWLVSRRGRPRSCVRAGPQPEQPASASTSATPVWWSALPLLSASTAAISWAECPAWRSLMIRARRSVLGRGGLLGPRLAVAKKSRAPVRKSCAIEVRLVTV